MAEPCIRFSVGATYERMMGRWSQLAGERFLDWLVPPSAYDGLTSAAAAARAPNCWSSAMPQPQSMKLFHVLGPKPVGMGLAAEVMDIA
jgi:hypothetical protein